MKIIVFISLLSVMVSCRSAGVDDHSHEEDTVAVHEESGEKIVELSSEQMKTAGIEIGSIEKKNLRTAIRANGTLRVPNQNKAMITSVSTGILKSLNIQPGSFVRKGETVATIINADAVRLQQDLQTTNAQIALAEIELKRQRELVEGNAAPLKNVQRINTELITLRSARNALSKQLSAIGISTSSVSKGNIITTIPVTAPISGTVSDVHAVIGSAVDASTPIAEIVNNSNLHVDLHVYEKDLPQLQKDQVIHFTLTNNPGREYDAKIFSIGTAFLNEAKTVPVHADVLGDKSGLIEGMNITALISISEDVVPAVPSDAIVRMQGQDYIFVQTTAPVKQQPHLNKKDANSPEKATNVFFQQIAIAKGVSDIGYTEITLLQEIPPGAGIVTKGAFFVMAKMSNSEGHAH